METTKEKDSQSVQTPEVKNISEDGKQHEHNQEEYERLKREQQKFM